MAINKCGVEGTSGALGLKDEKKKTFIDFGLD